MKDKSALQAWRKAAVPGVVVSRWTAARAGAIVSLWPTTEPRLSRYVEEMMSAHSHSVMGKGHGA